jgi:MazG family protein
MSIAIEILMKLAPLQRLEKIVEALRAPDGCPWDKEQTHESLIPHLLEEAYECVEAIQSGNQTHFCEELGDLLLQPFLQSQIAKESGEFTIHQVAEGICEKLIRRHPHVFGDGVAENTEEVLKNWEAIKIEEKGGVQKSYLAGVGQGLPALMKAAKIQKKVAKVHFDWQYLKDVVAKIQEELIEVEEAIQGKRQEEIEEEIGDLLFSVVNLARKLEVEPESALQQTNTKFTKRFDRMEQNLKQDGLVLGEVNLDVLDEYWNQAKRELKK